MFADINAEAVPSL